MGLTVPELARRSALSVDEIDRIEAGYHTSADVVVKMAEALRCSTDYLFGCGGAAFAQPLEAKKYKTEKQLETSEIDATN